MKAAGIDIGSRTIEIVITENSNIVEFQQADTGYNPLEQVNKLLRGLCYDRLMATGYGRQLVEIEFNNPTVTEIKAYATGVKHLFPEATTILDIGGQDCKVISLFNNGKIKKFEMNDRCAAGTGKFLEIMAKTLGFEVDRFGGHALKANKEIQISSMCTVFTESEVISLISKGENRNDIALGLHKSVAKRAVSMLKRIGANGTLVFAGGVAKNKCMIYLIEQFLNQKIIVPDYPQIVGAYGAALLAQSTKKDNLPRIK
jgi:predicted CoA-substrate-specific enzyme activase